MAAAVRAVQAGHQVTVFEAARRLGGRARAQPLTLPDGRCITLDNGQHILIGAYTESLRLMRLVGVEPDQVLLRLPLALTFSDGSGLALPDWPAPWDAAAGIVRARGWTWRDKLSLLRAASAWQRAAFDCSAHLSVAQLCASLTPTLRQGFIEPLCVSALNTPPAQASARVFLRVLRDAMFGARGGSNLLLPRTDLGALFPEPAGRWLTARGASVRLGQRVSALRAAERGWQVNGEAFDRVVIATCAPNAARAAAECAQTAPSFIAKSLQDWAASAQALNHEAITTVYAQSRTDASASGPLLRAPMLALTCSSSAPAQFVFDRDAISRGHEPTGLLSFVVSTSQGERTALEAGIVAQAQSQLGLTVRPLLTVAEKRATFACTPGLQRPRAHVAPGLIAVGDYIDGPYPATLEGAVLSAAAIDAFGAGTSTAVR